MMLGFLTDVLPQSIYHIYLMIRVQLNPLNGNNFLSYVPSRVFTYGGRRNVIYHWYELFRRLREDVCVQRAVAGKYIVSASLTVDDI